VRDDDLSLLGVSPSDRRRLEAMGITTLEQIVLMDRYSLGLSKGKSDSLIQAAANILANRHIKDVQIQGDLPPVVIPLLKSLTLSKQLQVPEDGNPENYEVVPHCIPSATLLSRP